MLSCADKTKKLMEIVRTVGNTPIIRQFEDLADSIIRDYTDEDGNIILADAYLLPSEYQIQVERNERRLLGISDDMSDYIKSHTRRVLYIGDCSVYGGTYAKYFDPEYGAVCKCPKNRIVRIGGEESG